MKKTWLFSNWHGGVMVKAVVHQAQVGEDRFPAWPRALLSWFQSGRKGHNSIQELFFREVTFSIFDQRHGEKDDVTMVKKTKYVA